MPLSWNEIKTRAVTFTNEWKDEVSEDAEAKSFWDDFFNVFGISRRRVATFEQKVSLTPTLSTGGEGAAERISPLSTLICQAYLQKTDSQPLNIFLYQGTHQKIGNIFLSVFLVLILLLLIVVILFRMQRNIILEFFHQRCI